MKFAVIGDIHSNIFALDSVIRDIEGRNVDFILSTGDLVGYLPFPNEVVNLVRSKGILTVQGNHDKYIGSCTTTLKESLDKMNENELTSKASAAYTNMIITDDNRSFLRNMPSEVIISLGGLKLILVHGSPRRIDEYMYEDSAVLEEILTETGANLVICGHTHIPYINKLNGKYVINAGSVGKPKHGNSNATYVHVEIINDLVSADIMEVSYEIDKLINTVEKNRMFDQRLPEVLRKGY